MLFDVVAEVGSSAKGVVVWVCCYSNAGMVFLF